MIIFLTHKQISKFPEYVDKWVKTGLSTERISFDQVKRIVNNLYKEILGYNENPIIILMDSPVSAWYATLFCNHIFNNNDQRESSRKSSVENQVWNQVRNQVENQVWNQVWNQVRNQVENQVCNQVCNQVGDQVRNQVEYQVGNQVVNQVENQVRNRVWNQVENQVWNQVGNQVEYQVGNQVEYQVGNQVYNQVENQVWNQVENQVWNQVWNQVGNQVWNQVWNRVWNQVGNQVWNQVWNQVRNQVWNQVRNQISNFIYPYIDGHFSSGYFSFYDYIENELDIDLGNKFSIYKETTKLELFYCFKDFCVVSQKPIEIHMKDKLLHNEKGPSIKYTDGFEFYFLHGNLVDKQIIDSIINKDKKWLLLNCKNTNILGYENIIRLLKEKKGDA